MGLRFDSKCDFTSPTVLLGLHLCLGHGVSFFGKIQHTPVDFCSAAGCDFGVLTGEDECTSFYSSIKQCNPLYWSSIFQTVGCDPLESSKISLLDCVSFNMVTNSLTLLSLRKSLHLLLLDLA